ncbi:MAG: hypothetical protein RSE46_22605, partial [Janthinobacterium sp.]
QTFAPMSVETASAAARMHGVFIFFLIFLFCCTPDKYCRRDDDIPAWRRVPPHPLMGRPLFFLIWIK